MTKTVVILGANGASGLSLCYQMLKNKYISKIIAISRSPLNLDEVDSNKLLRVTHDLFSLPQFKEIYPSTIDGVFCCLGTTRKKSKTAENFRSIDFDLCLKLAKKSRNAKIPYFALISAAGANSNLWAPKHPIFHPLLYSQTKGDIEQAISKLNFPCLHIYRPGLLNRIRKKNSRFFEKLASKIFPSLNTEDLALCMIKNFLEYELQKKKHVQIFENKDIKI